MTALIVGLFVILLLDQAVKLLVLHRLGRGPISLGPMGTVRVVQTQIWLVRARRRLTLGVIWILWILAASALAIMCALVPSFGWSSGLLLGGSLSHAVDTSLRGTVCDYVCLRFWPAFNMADVALTVGAFGMVVELFVAIHKAWL